MSEAEFGVGVDIGGTKILTALVHPDGRIVDSITRPTPMDGVESVLTSIEASIQTLLMNARQRGQKVVGIGVGTAGQVDFNRGQVVSGTSNLRDWFGVPMRDRLSSIFQLPVYVDNDVNVTALCEHRYGAGRGHTNLVFIACGTGVGGGVISDDRLLRGAWGAAGELGHVSVDMKGPSCNCGMKGCLEVFASGPNLVQRLKERWCAGEGLGGWLHHKYLANPEAFTSRDIVQGFRQGDEAATVVIHTMLEALSIGVVGFIHAFNPTVVVLGGGLLQEGEWIRDAVRHRLAHMGMQSLVQGTTVELARFGPESGVIGAASQVWTYGWLEEWRYEG